MNKWLFVSWNYWKFCKLNGFFKIIINRSFIIFSFWQVQSLILGYRWNYLFNSWRNITHALQQLVCLQTKYVFSLNDERKRNENRTVLKRVWATLEPSRWVSKEKFNLHLLFVLLSKFDCQPWNSDFLNTLSFFKVWYFEKYAFRRNHLSLSRTKKRDRQWSSLQKRVTRRKSLLPNSNLKTLSVPQTKF